MDVICNLIKGLSIICSWHINRSVAYHKFRITVSPWLFHKNGSSISGY
jgi:hypothetical protein